MKTFFLIILFEILYFFGVNALELGVDNLSEGWFAIVFIFVPLVFIPLAVFFIRTEMEQSTALKKCMAELKEKGFVPTHKITKGDTAIFVDGQKSSVCFVVFPFENPVNYTVHQPKRILSSKIITNGTETTSAASTSVVGRALIGGLLFGGVGAVIGGITARTETVSKISNLELKVLVDDLSNPSYKINFFTEKNGEKSTALIVQNAVKEIELWQIILELVMMEETVPITTTLEQLQDHIDIKRLKNA